MTTHPQAFGDSAVCRSPPGRTFRKYRGKHHNEPDAWREPFPALAEAA
jgi:hypothetical protein